MDSELMLLSVGGPKSAISSGSVVVPFLISEILPESKLFPTDAQPESRRQDIARHIKFFTNSFIWLIWVSNARIFIEHYFHVIIPILSFMARKSVVDFEAVSKLPDAEKLKLANELEFWALVIRKTIAAAPDLPYSSNHSQFPPHPPNHLQN